MTKTIALPIEFWEFTEQDIDMLEDEKLLDVVNGELQVAAEEMREKDIQSTDFTYQVD
jgi:hypothetical protein